MGWKKIGVRQNASCADGRIPAGWGKRYKKKQFTLSTESKSKRKPYSSIVIKLVDIVIQPATTPSPPPANPSRPWQNMKLTDVEGCAQF